MHDLMGVFNKKFNELAHFKEKCLFNFDKSHLFLDIHILVIHSKPKMSLFF